MPLRAAELEVLFTADTTDIGKAEKDVKAAGQRIEGKPITATIEGDASDALGSMDRVAAEAKKLVSRATVVTIDSNITRAQKSADTIQKRLDYLRTVETDLDVTADIRRAEASLSKVKRSIDGLTAARAKVDIDVDAEGAAADIAKINGEVRRLVSQDTIVRVETDIAKAEADAKKLRDELGYLAALMPSMVVDADISRAEGRLQRVQTRLEALVGARNVMEVDADTAKAEGELKQLAGKAATAGENSGRSFAESLDGATRGAGTKVGEIVGGDIEGSLVAALTAIPIAGGIILGGVAIGKAIVGGIQDGMQVEVSQDRLQGLTGISEADALRLSRIAGEAYTRGFGESIESNMDTTRLALQFDLIDPEATNQSSQKVIEGLSGIADVLGEDIKPVATAVTTLLRNGMASSAQEAFDIIAAGARNGVDRNEDLLDTLTEYPSVLTKLGLSGEEAMGLLNQGLKAGARNSDVVADALKEVQIRATDSSEASAKGYELIGYNAEEMTAKIAAGGAGAKEGLQQILDGLRNLKDPTEQNAAGLALFGTKWEDLSGSILALDLSNAVEQLDGVQGAAQRMFDTLADNDASKLEGAKRNIEVAVQGMQGALAAAFSEPLADAAEWISQNRGPMLQFFLDLANGALDFGDSMIESAASGTEALGEFVSGPLAAAVEGLGSVIGFFDSKSGDELKAYAEDMRGFSDETDVAADVLRERMGSALDEARSKLNEFGEGAVAMGYLNDASLRLADSLSVVGVNGDGTRFALEGIDLANLAASESGSVLESQIRAAITAMSEEVDAAAAAGESQEALAGRYDTATSALVNQLVQMGLTEEQARNLIGTINETPGQKSTEFSSNADAQTEKVKYLGSSIVQLPNGNVIVTADTATASARIAEFVRDLNNIPGRRDVVINQVVQTTGAPQGQVGAAYNGATGGLLEFMALGGIRNLTPMSSAAQMVSPNSWRVVGDRGDVPELFAPLDGSARSWALILEGLARMPGSPSGQAQPVMAASVPAAAGSSAPQRIVGTLDLGNGLTAVIDAQIQDYDKRQKQTKAGDWS